MILPHDSTNGASVASNLELIRKYAVPGPRYTSYPPANRFHEDLGSVDLDSALAVDNADPNRPLSLYFHLPFCESRCWYCGCTTIITRRFDWADAYLTELKREIDLVARRINGARPVEQLHFGGGTPTFFSPETLRELGRTIHANFTFTSDAELSIEIDPRCVTPEHVEVLAEMGINRASLGIQDTNLEVQEAIHRVQPMELNQLAVATLREAGIQDINFDLIYGLPCQTVETVTQTIDDVLTLEPDRLSVFSYAHVPWIKPAQRIFDQRGQMPDAEAKLTLFGVIRGKLLETKGSSISVWTISPARLMRSPLLCAKARCTAISRATAPRPGPRSMGLVFPPFPRRRKSTGKIRSRSPPIARLCAQEGSRLRKAIA